MIFCTVGDSFVVAFCLFRLTRYCYLVTIVQGQTSYNFSDLSRFFTKVTQEPETLNFLGWFQFLDHCYTQTFRLEFYRTMSILLVSLRFRKNSVILHVFSLSNCLIFLLRHQNATLTFRNDKKVSNIRKIFGPDSLSVHFDLSCKIFRGWILLKHLHSYWAAFV